MSFHRTTIAAVAALSVLAAAGCGGSAAPDKSGGSGTAVALRLGTSDRPGFPGAKALRHFAAEVRRRSHGSLRIAIAYQAGGAERPAYDQAVADLVRRGRLDLAAVPARAWDVEGVRSLRALQVPFLLEAHDQVARVLADRELAGAMLAGLRPLGVTGLALVPGGLRHPFGLRGPLRSPHDFVGASIRAPRSDATWALLRALGARPVDLAGRAEREAIRRGAVAGAESELALARGSLPVSSTATGNVTFFPRIDALVANSRSLARLSAANRAALRQSAAETAAWARGANPSEREAARGFCRSGGRVVAASAGDVRALRAAARPVTAALEGDPATRALVARVRALAGAPSAGAAPPACGPPAGARDSRPAGGHESARLNGVYRNASTVRDFVSHGVDESSAIDNAGVHTIVLRNGRLHDTLRTTPSSPPGKPCEGRYSVRGSTYTFAWDPATPCSGDFTATWSLRDGELRLTSISGHDPVDHVLWGLKPFRRIG
jgi:C4-dicarboxylate-binding protein DctP